jgi:hypothetical protein
MRIPDASFAQATAIINAKVNRLTPCPACGTRDWRIDQEIYEMRPFSGETNPFYQQTGGTYPLVLLGCSNCGHIRLFSAIKLGLVKPDGSPVLA